MDHMPSLEIWEWMTSGRVLLKLQESRSSAIFVNGNVIILYHKMLYTVNNNNINTRRSI